MIRSETSKEGTVWEGCGGKTFRQCSVTAETFRETHQSLKVTATRYTPEM